MKEALYYEQLEDSSVRCVLCPRRCVIGEGCVGVCKSRKNISGKLFSLTYGRMVAMHIDPIEKKPLFHFLPESKTFSIGPVGCNLMCQHCQNWQISTKSPSVDTDFLSPSKVVELALNNGCSSISYTYTEPTIFYEYVLETARLARDNGLKNIIVSNGYINSLPLRALLEHVDAANIDLKGFSDKFYKDVCFAELTPVLETLKTIAKSKTWLEITNLIIPEHNDNLDTFEDMCRWIDENCGKDVPLHISRFFPHHKMSDVKATPLDTLESARSIARKYLDYVYLGNVSLEGAENTNCVKCGRLVIGRSHFGILVNKLKDGRCPCGQPLKGVW